MARRFKPHEASARPQQKPTPSRASVGLLGAPPASPNLTKMMTAMFKTLKLRWYVRRLKDNRWDVRTGAAKALGELGDPRAVEPLMAALADSDSVGVRQTAAEALGLLGDPRAVEPLIRALGDGEGWVANAAAEALGKLGDPRAIEPLIRALGDPLVYFRSAAAKALAKLGDPRAVEPLVRALGDPILLQQRAWNIVERLAAFNALRQLASAHPSAIGQRWGEIQQRAWNIGLNFPDPPPGLNS